MGFDNQDCDKPPISLHLWTLYLSHLLLDRCQISYIDYFNQTLAQVSIWALSNNQDDHQNGRQVSNLVIWHPISYRSYLNMGFAR